MASGEKLFGQLALDLAGSGNRVETVADFDVTNGFTVEYDMYMNHLQNYNAGITKGCSNVGAPLDAYVKSDGTCTVFYGNCSITGGGDGGYTFSATTWYHITHTYDPVAAQGLLYVNGVLITTWAVSAGVGNGTVPMMIGDRADGATDADAKYDNVRVWSGVRSAADIQKYMNTCLTGTETGLEILYTMEESTGAVLHDLATNNGIQNGNIIGTVAWDAGTGCSKPLAAALNFDGSDDDITITSTTNIPINNSPYTIEAWIQPTNVNATSGIVGWGNYGGGNQVNAFRTTTQGGLDNYWWGNDLVVSPTDFNLYDGNWHHIAATYDGTTRSIYVDGILKASDMPGTNGVPDASNFTVGKTCCSEFFNGSMDEVRIWNVARTQCEISSNMNCELAGAQVGLALYYRFNEGFASDTNLTVIIAADSSGNGNNGTLKNYALTGSSSNWIAPGAITPGISCGIGSIPTISVNTATICAGSTCTLTASGASTYTWSTGETTASISPTLTVTTTYTVTGANVGCVGTITNTTIATVNNLPVVSVSGTTVVCNGSRTTLTAVGADTYTWTIGPSTATNTVSPTANATYTVVGTSSTTGCNDTAYQAITVNPISTSSQTVTLCAGKSITVGANTYTSNGTYVDVLTAANGCDSTVTTNLTVLPVNATSHTLTICAGKSITIGVNTYTTNGTYIDILTAANGCDSIVTTNLTVNTIIDITVLVNGNTITANATGSSYQWVDCNNAKAIITGQTNQSYTASDGSYAVIITENTCSDTSACTTIASTDIVQVISTNALTLFPNPNTGAFTIKTNVEGTYTIINELGQTINRIYLNSTNNYLHTIDNLDNGIYYIIGYTNYSIVKQKIIVTK